MTNKRYTDEEIIKALEDYIKENEFEYFHSNMMGEYPLISKSLDLINRQKAEIERLEKTYKADQRLISALNKSYNLAKAKAYKEFVERLKEKYGIFTPLGVNWIEETKVVRVSDIDNLLKEMVGDTE